MKEILKYWIVGCCAFIFLAGIIILIDVYNVENMGFFYYSDILNERIHKIYIFVGLILFPIGIWFSVKLKNEIIYAIMIVLEKLSFVSEYSFINNKSYIKSRIIYFVISIITLVIVFLWAMKKIDNIFLLGILLLSQIEGLNWLVKNGKNAKSFVFVLMLFGAILIVKVFPIYVIKSKKKAG